MISIGLLLIAMAGLLTIYNRYDEWRAEREAEKTMDDVLAIITDKSVTGMPTGGEDLPPAGTGTSAAGDNETDIPDYLLSPNMEMPSETIRGMDIIGILRIPSLHLELPVIRTWDYAGLKNAPCRYAGSVYLDNMIICGHNYGSHFGNLRLLSEGDSADFTDMDGNVFFYKMIGIETLPATYVEEMEAGDWDLTLFTCSVSGQNRVTIRFARINGEKETRP